MLPDELKRIWDIEEGGVAITELRYPNDSTMDIDFFVRDDSEGTKQDWKLTISNIKEEKISLDYGSELKITDNHYLLLPYNQPSYYLYFKNKSTNPHALIGELLIEHLKYFEWFAIDRFLNTELSLLSLCEADNGLFATGPREILDVYKKCLERYNKEPYYFSWNKKTPHKENEKLKILFLGTSYFIGEQFEFTKQ